MVGYNKGGGIAIALIGLLLLFAGIAMWSYEETVIDLYFIEVVDRPYEDVGAFMMVMGFVLIIIGVIVAAMPGERSAPPIQPAMYPAPPPIQPTMYPTAPQPATPPAAPPSSGAFCMHCGRQLPLEATFCPGCGKKSS